MDAEAIGRLMHDIRLIRKPKKLLSTFGSTRIQYHLLSPVDGLPDKARLREGWVVSERPKVLTAEALRDRFEGFGEHSDEFARWLSNEYRELLRALEYRFKNQDLTVRVLSQDPHALALKIRSDVDSRDVPQAAVIECPDSAWSLALMRFTLDEAARSFPTNVRDLDLRGMFDPDEKEAKRRRALVESLFEDARRDPESRRRLGATLREFGLFEEYEDRFLSLFP
jgi:hypothetical protein